ncbi:MAG: hypothetical protein GWP19_15115 [Planctomycetia bacterium]|nr:hypothetical protein [Planctomycetia bacterium]
MEQIAISSGLLMLGIGSLIAVKVGLKDRPTFKEANSRYKEANVCDEIHKNVNEKLDCIPEIKKSVVQIETKLDILINNGKK